MKKLDSRLVVCRTQIFMNSGAKCTLPCFQDTINSSFILCCSLITYPPPAARRAEIRQRRVVDIRYCRSVRSALPRCRTRESYWNLTSRGVWVDVVWGGGVRNWRKVAKLIYSVIGSVAGDGSVSGCLAPYLMLRSIWLAVFTKYRWKPVSPRKFTKTYPEVCTTVGFISNKS